MSQFHNSNSHSVVIIQDCIVSGLSSKKCVPVCREITKIFMEDIKDYRMSNITITGNSSKPWIHFINACEYYILKSKTDDEGICFKQ